MEELDPEIDIATRFGPGTVVEVQGMAAVLCSSERPRVRHHRLSASCTGDVQWDLVRPWRR